VKGTDLAGAFAVVDNQLLVLVRLKLDAANGRSAEHGVTIEEVED
jgi:hypothetical protein